MDKEEYYAYMDAKVAAMTEEKREALISAIKLLFRAFVEDKTRGVLILADDSNCLTTMGLNATYYEAAEIVDVAMYVMNESSDAADRETKH